MIKIPEICEPYGTKVIAIGGHKAINAAKDKIIKACEKYNLEILDFIWYGGEATYEKCGRVNEESFSTAGRYDFCHRWR